MKYKKTIILALIFFIGVSYSFKDRFFEIAKQIEIYNNVFKTLNFNYIDEINPGDLTQKVINNTLKDFDPYTRFYNEQLVEDANIRRQGEYAGVGISTWYTDKGIVITYVKKDHPADKSGIKVGDIIIEVNGESLLDMNTEQMSEVLKGSPNSKISIKLKRKSVVKEMNLILDKIEINPVPFFDMINKDTGYIVLTRFTNVKATEQVRTAFLALEKRGMKNLVFDLRHNPGGSLFDAVNITNLFIEKDKVVVQTKGKSKESTRTYKTKNLPLDLEIPIVVLIDERSASASEIVSGSLQDYDRAVVMGERSFGKGLVQRYFKLNYGTQMKVTISKYYTPSGRCIQELDYANRDPKTKKVPKFSDGKVNTFKTTNGRLVYDGGGVTPDVVVNLSKIKEETQDLLKSQAIFSYALEHLAEHPKADMNTFKFTDRDFAKFTKYLVEKDTTFITKQERKFKEAFKLLKNKAIVQSDYNSLLGKLKKEKVAIVTKNKDRIKEKITKELLNHYFYKKGMYQYLLKNDITIQKAVTLLNNSKEYNNMLSK